MRLINYPARIWFHSWWICYSEISQKDHLFCFQGKKELKIPKQKEVPLNTTPDGNSDIIQRQSDTNRTLATSGSPHQPLLLHLLVKFMERLQCVSPSNLASHFFLTPESGQIRSEWFEEVCIKQHYFEIYF